jgi:hypothetical protein
MNWYKMATRMLDQEAWINLYNRLMQKYNGDKDRVNLEIYQEFLKDLFESPSEDINEIENQQNNNNQTKRTL